MARYFIGVMFLALGLSALFGLDLGRFIGPLFLIWIGVMIVSGRSRRHFTERSEVSHDPSLNEVWVFTGVRRKIAGDNFQGGKVTAIFGGAELDLSDVKAKGNEVELELTAVFGGIRMRVPEDWRVESEAVGILGGVDNHTSRGDKVTLRIKGAAIFGGIELSN